MVVGGIIGGVWGASGSTDAPPLMLTVMVFSGLISLLINYFVFRFFVNLFIVEKLAPSLHGAA
jgi:hypothetical protein